jgi:hypothetical protein
MVGLLTTPSPWCLPNIVPCQWLKVYLSRRLRGSQQRVCSGFSPDSLLIPQVFQFFGNQFVDKDSASWAEYKINSDLFLFPWHRLSSRSKVCKLSEEQKKWSTTTRVMLHFFMRECVKGFSPYTLILKPCITSACWKLHSFRCSNLYAWGFRSSCPRTS